MSLIIALAKSKEAIIGGDHRSITFLGKCPELEQDLYSGKLRTVEDMLERAKELKASLQVADDREKVWLRGDMLVGEVTEISPAAERRRRIYLVPGAYVVADINGKEAHVTDQGNVACIVLGNRFTQELASQGIKKVQGKIDEHAVRAILAEAGSRTPSVSPEHCVLLTNVQQPDPVAAVFCALQEDCIESGWRLCGQQ
jgi:hypothetical protein